MSYILVATYNNREEAKNAYSHLEATDLPLSQLNLVGPGDKTLQDIGLTDPNQIAWRQAMRMLWWVVPFGFAAGFGFNDITKLSIVPQAPSLLNHFLGGLLGAVSAAMGGFTFGGGAQILVDREKMPLEKRLKAGKYLVVAQGTDLLIRQTNRALQEFPSDSLQSYKNES